MKTVFSEEQKIRNLPWAAANMVVNAASAQLTYSGPFFILLLFQTGLQRSFIGIALALFHLTNLSGLFITPVLARRGYKSVYWIATALRHAFFLLLVASLLLQLPLPAFVLLIIIAVVAVMRTVSETSYNSWFQQFVPGAYYNRFSIITTVISSVLTALVMIMTTLTIGNNATPLQLGDVGLVGVALGVLAMLLSSPVSGEKQSASNVRRIYLREILDTLHQRHFTLLLFGSALINLTLAALAFVPLLLLEQVRFDIIEIVIITAAALVSAMGAGFLWNFVIDRWGSRPVTTLSVLGLISQPLLWMILPLGAVVNLPLALLFAVLMGIWSAGWHAGSIRFLLTNVIPSDKQTQFLSVQHFINSLASAVGLVLVGVALDYFTASPVHISTWQFGAYTPVFAAGSLICLLAIGVIRLTNDRRSMGTRHLAALLLRGNPLRALRLLVQYRHAGAESERASVTENIGTTKSMLAATELLDAMSDPSFSVRREAISAIPRLPKDERLMNVLFDVLRCNEPELISEAIWAFGKLGEKRAIEPLREFLTSQHSLLRANSARALATLGDYDIAPLLLERFRKEDDEGLSLAYASALGSLRAKDALPDLLTFLRILRGKDPRMELAFAISRLVSGADEYARLARALRSRGVAVISNELADIRRTPLVMHSTDLSVQFDNCIHSINTSDTEQGIRSLAVLLAFVYPIIKNATAKTILVECSQRITEFGSARLEYVLLALDALHAAVT